MRRHQETAVEEDFEPNYESGFNCISRRFFFVHLIEILFTVKKQLKHGREITKDHIKNITSQDDSERLSEEFLENLERLRYNQANQRQEITSGLIFQAAYDTFKGHIWFLFSIYMIDVANRIVVTFILQFLLQELANRNYQMAYLYAGILSLSLYVQVLLRHNQFYEGPILGGKIRCCLILALLKKVSHLNQYVSNRAEIGKITNMLSNDFNVIEIKAPFFFVLTTIPFVYIAFIVVLVVRLGWPGILCVITPVVFLPLQAYIGKLNGKLLTDINVFKDKRVKLATELIEGIKHIKIYGWELIFSEMIRKVRLQELMAFIKIAVGRSLQNSLSDSTAIFGCFFAFVTVAYTSNDLTDAKVFSTLEFVSFLKIATAMATLGIGFIYELEVVFKRFANMMNLSVIRMENVENGFKTGQESKHQKFHFQVKDKPLDQSQIELYEITLKTDKLTEENQSLEEGQILVKDFNAYYKEDLNSPTLTSINLKICKGKFYGISGKVGSGKSALMSAFIKELPYYSGKCEIKGKVSFVQQEAVLFSLTVKDNIVFGRPFDEQKYRRVTEAACLISDFKLFHQRDQTLIGQKGVTLSGGQKARLILARALYEDADIYIFDDPLSAVDTKVAKKIYDNAFMGYLKGKTVILSTHQIHFLEDCEKVLVMEKGKAIAFDKYPEVEKYLKQIEQEEEKQKASEEKQPENPRADENTLVVPDAVKPRKLSVEQSEYSETAVEQNRSENNIKVTLSTYKDYLLFWSPFVFALSVLLIVFDEVLYAFFFRMLTFNDEVKSGGEAMFGIQGKDGFWLGLGLLTLFYFLFGFLKYVILYISLLKNNTLIHEEMIMHLSRAKPYYFDIVPSGVFINKISNDIGILDTTLIFSLYFAIQGISLSVVLLINIFQIDTYQIIVGMAGVIATVLFFLYCKETIIEAKQLDLKMKSPVFKGLNELISGLVQIHLFNRRSSYVKELRKRINDSLRSNFGYWFMCRVFGAYATFILMLVSICSIFIGIATIDPQREGLYAVTVVFFLTMMEVGQWTARQLINTESIMVSAERCMNVTAIQSEKELATNYDRSIGIDSHEEQHVAESIKPEKNTDGRNKWPKNPSIRVSDFRFRYREQLPLVLKGIDFEIKAGEKVGIVGRTGAGKSSIIQAFLRLSQPEPGSIYEIDGCDAMKMGLHSLRTHISIIPQQPFLFKGTIRNNIDPFDMRTDEEIYSALEKVSLRAFIEELPEKLETDLTNAIEIFSVGQKQLFCLSRVILYRNKIIILDEATSNIDFQTDKLIQDIIRSQFKSETIITIAHRLNTLTDYDKIIVMDKGKVSEIGSPSELMDRKGKFYDMVSYTGKGMSDLVKAIFKMRDSSNNND